MFIYEYCMYIHIDIHIFVDKMHKHTYKQNIGEQMYVYILTCVNNNIYIYMLEYIHIIIYTCIYIYYYLHMLEYIHTCHKVTYKHIYYDIHIYIYIYIVFHIYIHIYVHMCTCV